jgi:hypothetical protein
VTPPGHVPRLMLHPGHFGRDWSLLLLFQLMLPLSQREGDWHRLSRCLRLQLCCYTTNAVDWVVWRSNHRAIPSSATTGLDLPARLAPSGTTPCTVPRPKGPVYRLRGRWAFIYVMPQDVAVYRHAGRSSLTSWGTFRATQAVPGRDVLVATALVFLACESHELIRDVSHHG